MFVAQFQCNDTAPKITTDFSDFNNNKHNRPITAQHFCKTGRFWRHKSWRFYFRRQNWQTKNRPNFCVENLDTLCWMMKTCRRYWQFCRVSDIGFTCIIMCHSVMKKEVRSVRQLQYTTWPDHGVPNNCQHFLEFVRVVRQEIEQRSTDGRPTLVHCR